MVADALTKLSACCDCMDDEEEPLLQKTAEERRSERDILVVAFLGTMDDLVVYFSVAVSGKIPGVDLVIGTTVGAVALALSAVVAAGLWTVGAPGWLRFALFYPTFATGAGFAASARLGL